MGGEEPEDAVTIKDTQWFPEAANKMLGIKRELNRDEA